ncbi:MAG: TonB-dependent receptor [Bacteroidetes bacterium]|nr:TonB-dependent receptor [Bacteroidota bacterium]
MRWKGFALILFGIFLLEHALAQQDSLLLHPESLLQQDIYTPLELEDKNVKIVSGSRFPIAAADLPFSTHIITREEIRRNGYETLVDALKMVPGIRVSQPGSATEGETFQMRGLLGNTYAKILINDVPIKPSFLAAMPIGAQLPIKEAERIEIIYGAGAALYGADAAAGVINIITRQSDKPVFMQADLSVGSGVFSSVNVMFGGRLGRDKRIFKYFAYGSNTVYEQRNIFYDREVNYNPSNYDSTSLYLKSINYIGEPGRPPLNSTPHLSRKFGFNLNYKRLTLSLETMYRRDHSSLGLNTAAVSYSNPQNWFGESIVLMNLNIVKEKAKKNRKTDISYIRYGLDARSSSMYVQPRLANMFLNGAKAEAARLGNPDTAMFFFDRNYSRFIAGQSYYWGHSTEFRIDHVRNYRLFKILTLTVGLNARVGGGRPQQSYLPRAVIEDRAVEFSFQPDSALIEAMTNRIGFAKGSFYAQLFYGGKKFTAVVGDYNTSYISSFNNFDRQYSGNSPRAAVLWKAHKNVNVRTSWGLSFRSPNEFYKYNSYQIFQEQPLEHNFRALEPERSTSWETGVRIKDNDGRLGLDVTYFFNRNENLISYGSVEISGIAGPQIYDGRIGYFNLKNSSLRTRGGQVTAFFESNVNGHLNTDSRLTFFWQRSTLATPGFNQERFDLASPLSNRTWQFTNAFHPFKDVTLQVDMVRYVNNKYLDKRNLTDNKFYTWDVVLRYAFTSRFDGYMKIINLFNKEYGGIPVTADPADRLIYNPQTGFFIRLGMNYYIE